MLSLHCDLLKCISETMKKKKDYKKTKVMFETLPVISIYMETSVLSDVIVVLKRVTILIGTWAAMLPGH